MDINDLAKKIETGEIELKDALRYLKVSFDDIAKIEDYYGLNLLQIAIKNNYNYLVDQLINGIYTEEMVIDFKVQPPTRKKTLKHIELLSKFDLFKPSKEGYCAIDYALMYNKEAFYKLLNNSRDRRIYSIVFDSPTKGHNLTLLNYLFRTFMTNQQNNELNLAIHNIISEPTHILNTLDRTSSSWLFSNYILSDNELITKFVNIILNKITDEKASELWNVIMDICYNSKNPTTFCSNLTKEQANKLLNIQESLLHRNIYVSQSDLAILNNTKLFNSNNNESLKGREFIRKYHDLFLFNADDTIYNYIDKPSSILRAKFGDNYEEILKQELRHREPSRKLLKKIIKCKFDDNNPRITLLPKLGLNMITPDESGHTLFSELTSDEILKVFKYFDPPLSNQAIYDITSKRFLSELYITKNYFDANAIRKVYKAICDYTPTEDVESFCTEMANRVQNITPESFFDLNAPASYDSVLENIVFGTNGEGGYIAHLQEIKKRSSKQQTDKAFFSDIKEAMAEIKRLTAENEKLRLLISALKKDGYHR